MYFSLFFARFGRRPVTAVDTLIWNYVSIVLSGSLRVPIFRTVLQSVTVTSGADFQPGNGHHDLPESATLQFRAPKHNTVGN